MSEIGMEFIEGAYGDAPPPPTFGIGPLCMHLVILVFLHFWLFVDLDFCIFVFLNICFFNFSFPWTSTGWLKKSSKLGDLVGHFGFKLGVFVVFFLGPSGRSWEPFWCQVRALWGLLGSKWQVLGTILPPSWQSEFFVVRSWPSWVQVGASLGSSWG